MANTKLLHEYKVQLKSLREQLSEKQNELEQLILQGKDFMSVYKEKNQLLIKIKTVQSRIDNHGKSGGLPEYSIPNQIK